MPDTLVSVLLSALGTSGLSWAGYNRRDCRPSQHVQDEFGVPGQLFTEGHHQNLVETFLEGKETLLAACRG